MRLDQVSAGALSFRQPHQSKARLDTGRLANLAFMAIVLAIAALWLAFPPAQLTNSGAPQTRLAQDLLAKQDLPAKTLPR
ncbi:hypothetical protein SAMN05444161_1138 [Rhizobiales bacterium GAS191]|jgi:hypothetical protein|nr:hypothetical protein SAMN05519103_00171 [Rhizobiales bacterium GAS113]SEC43886.1 hypothetical protein SAMN05444161_1138 [Rhizobiales bacterium GAS191]